MNQQCWCWGCDVKHRPHDAQADCNVLMDYGLSRHRPAPGVGGCTAYTLDLHTTRDAAEPPTRLWLWGFGVAIGTMDRAIFVNRFDLRPRDIPGSWLPSLHGQHHVEPFDALTAAGHVAFGWLRCLWQWMADYERWVHHRLGGDYRRRCLASWHQKAGLAADDMAWGWASLAAAPASSQTPANPQTAWSWPRQTSLFQVA